MPGELNWTKLEDATGKLAFEGLYFRVPGTELKAHFRERAQWHSARQELYDKQVKELEAARVGDDPTPDEWEASYGSARRQGGNPADQLRGRRDGHALLKRKYQAMHALASATDIYILSDRNLSDIEWFEVVHHEEAREA